MTKKASIILWTVTILALLHNFFLPLHPDEAYYWVWSRHLGLSYFDGPPLTAYLIRLTTFFWSSPFTIRLVSVLMVLLTGCSLYHFAKRVFNHRVAEIVLIIFIFIPFIQAGLSITTLDLPLMLFWTLSFIAFYDYLILNDEKKIYWVGVYLGFALLAKYPAVLLILSFAILVWIFKRFDIFKTKSLYRAMMITVLIFSPVILWNILHQFASFQFQLNHGASVSSPINLSYVIEYLSGQFGAFNPFFFGLLIVILFKFKNDIKKDSRLLFLLVPFLVTFLAFLLFSINKHSEVNWPAPGYISVVVIIGYYVEKMKWQKWMWSGVVLSLIAVMIFIFPGFSPVLKSKFWGYNSLMQSAQTYLPDNAIILSDNYQDASEAEFYLKGHPTVYVLTPTRYSQYDIWATKKVKEMIQNSDRPVYFIGTNNQLGPLGDYFSTLTLVQVLKYQRDNLSMTLYIIQCSEANDNSNITTDPDPSIPAE